MYFGFTFCTIHNPFGFGSGIVVKRPKKTLRDRKQDIGLFKNVYIEDPAATGSTGALTESPGVMVHKAVPPLFLKVVTSLFLTFCPVATSGQTFASP